MSDGVVVADERGKFVLFNPAAEQILQLGKIDAPPEEWSERYSLYLAGRPVATFHRGGPPGQSLAGRTVRMTSR